MLYVTESGKKTMYRGEVNIVCDINDILHYAFY